jgi:hypothetical protein
LAPQFGFTTIRINLPSFLPSFHPPTHPPTYLQDTDEAILLKPIDFNKAAGILQDELLNLKRAVKKGKVCAVLLSLDLIGLLL